MTLTITCNDLLAELTGASAVVTFEINDATSTPITTGKLAEFVSQMARQMDTCLEYVSHAVRPMFA